MSKKIHLLVIILAFFVAVVIVYTTYLQTEVPDTTHPAFHKTQNTNQPSINDCYSYENLPDNNEPIVIEGFLTKHGWAKDKYSYCAAGSDYFLLTTINNRKYPISYSKDLEAFKNKVVDIKGKLKVFHKGCAPCDGPAQCMETGCKNIEVEEINSAQKSTDQNFTIQDLQMTMPKTWQLDKQSDSTVFLQTDYQPYNVLLVLRVRNTSQQDAEDGFDFTKTPSAEIFKLACGGTLACNGAIIGDETYTFSWSIQTSQPVPKDLDSIWVPEHNVTQEDIWAILKTITKIN